MRQDDPGPLCEDSVSSVPYVTTQPQLLLADPGVNGANVAHDRSYKHPVPPSLATAGRNTWWLKRPRPRRYPRSAWPGSRLQPGRQGKLHEPRPSRCHRRHRHRPV